MIQVRPRLEGRTIVITGAASGIGEATVRRALAEGAYVAAVDHDAQRLEALAAELGRDALGVFQADVRDEQGPARVLEALARDGRAVDGVVPCAGVTSGATFLASELELWRRVFDINLMGVVIWTRACVAQMVEAQSGAVVLIGSQLTHGGAAGNAAYVTSKGAIAALAKTMAFEVAGKGVRVNCLSPGATATPLLANAMAKRPDPEAAAERSRQRHAMRRFGEPQEIAGAACFLLSDEASFITGAELLADGGWAVA
jgi:NAD(P)-dependent dehydrogenase (short-subunit alcohol dehydrogenase family)